VEQILSKFAVLFECEGKLLMTEFEMFLIDHLADRRMSLSVFLFFMKFLFEFAELFLESEIHCDFFCNAPMMENTHSSYCGFQLIVVDLIFGAKSCTCGEGCMCQRCQNAVMDLEKSIKFIFPFFPKFSVGYM
jgi:hypothetical protein